MNTFELKISEQMLLSKLYHLACVEKFMTILDSCGINGARIANKYDLLVAWGANDILTEFNHHNFNHWIAENWVFGVIGYDLKNEIEYLPQPQKEPTELPRLALFKPKHVIAARKDGKIEVWSDLLESDFKVYFQSIPDYKKIRPFGEKPKLHQRTEKQTYLQTVKEIKRLIKEGDVYELNYCINFYCRPANLVSPVSLYQKLILKNPSPFAGFHRFANKYLLSSSPERFLKKDGNVITSQPIKGTIRRNGNADDEERNILLNSDKDRAENVMIVDLVRNDLAKISDTGSVTVDELFGIYTYPAVHQMISTVSADLAESATFKDILFATFPMGSMTGAPKIAAMKTIDKLEAVNRQWYSGALGYISPDGNFDFNVVIRSFIYDKENDYLSVTAGSAITIDSVPEAEYEECVLKAEALLNLINQPD